MGRGNKSSDSSSDSGLLNELTSIRKQLDNMTEDIKRILTITSELEKKNKELEKENKEKDEKISLQQQRIEDLEQYTRMDDIIISGLVTKHRTYANVTSKGTTNETEETEEEVKSLETQVIEQLAEKGIVLKDSEISAIHTLGRKKNPNIIVRFYSRKSKGHILKQAKSVSLGTQKIYISEHLTNKNAEIAGIARRLKKAKRIEGTWVRHCKVYIKQSKDQVKEGQEQTIHYVRSLSMLDELDIEYEDLRNTEKNKNNENK